MTESFMLWLRGLFGLSKPKYNAYYQPGRTVIQTKKRDGSGNWLVWNWNNTRWDERKGPLNKHGELDAR